VVETRKILVTGGAGFVGSHLVERLIRDGCPVTVVDDLSTGRLDQVAPEARFIHADIRDGSKTLEIFSRESPEVVIHLAGQANVRWSLADPEYDLNVNVLGSISVFKASVKAGVRRVVFASSGGAVYGDQPIYPCRESDPPSPSSPYGISKLAAELYGKSILRASGIALTILRLANVYGPRQDPTGEAGVVALFLSELLADGVPTIFGDGGQTRDFVWVGDVVEAFVKSTQGPEGTYNVGTGKETRILDLYAEVGHVLGTIVPPRAAPPVRGEVRRNVLSVDQAEELLGWTARMDLPTGLLETAEHFKKASPVRDRTNKAKAGRVTEISPEPRRL
jgi:UDP-glucose 4-epimerase